MCTFQDPEDSDGEPIVYQSFDVDPILMTPKYDIRPNGICHIQGELRVPPVAESAEEVTLHCILIC